MVAFPTGPGNPLWNKKLISVSVLSLNYKSKLFVTYKNITLSSFFR